MHTWYSGRFPAAHMLARSSDLAATSLALFQLGQSEAPAALEEAGQTDARRFLTLAMGRSHAARRTPRSAPAPPYPRTHSTSPSQPPTSPRLTAEAAVPCVTSARYDERITAAPARRWRRQWPCLRGQGRLRAARAPLPLPGGVLTARGEVGGPIVRQA